jgi:hypothetical protein
VTILAKGQHDASLTLLNNKEPADQPEEKDNSAGNTSTNASIARIITIIRRAATSATATFAAEKSVDALVEFAPQLIKIRRAIIRSTVLPRLFPVAVRRTATPTRIIEGKDKAEFFSY